MTTIQDRIIKQLDNNKNLFDWQKPELKQFLIQSIKEVEEETRNEDIEIIENLKLKHSINPNSPSRERKIIYNKAIEDAKLSITNKEKQ